MAFLSFADKQQIRQRVQALQESKQLRDKNAQRQFRSIGSIGRLMHFIGLEKPHFKSLIKPETFLDFIVALPKRSNPRIAAQSGAFVVFGCGSTIYSARPGCFRSVRLVVPADVKPRLLGELDKLNVNERTMFPEIDRTANFLKAQYG